MPTAVISSSRLAVADSRAPKEAVKSKALPASGSHEYSYGPSWNPMKISGLLSQLSRVAAVAVPVASGMVFTLQSASTLSVMSSGHTIPGTAGA